MTQPPPIRYPAIEGTTRGRDIRELQALLSSCTPTILVDTEYTLDPPTLHERVVIGQHWRGGKTDILLRMLEISTLQYSRPFMQLIDQLHAADPDQRIEHEFHPVNAFAPPTRLRELVPTMKELTLPRQMSLDDFDLAMELLGNVWIVSETHQTRHFPAPNLQNIPRDVSELRTLQKSWAMTPDGYLGPYTEHDVQTALEQFNVQYPAACGYKKK